MPAQHSSSVVQIGEWTVHPALDSISRGAETQKLEPRMMRLLMCLADSAGEVVSVDRLLNEVWAGVVVGSASVYKAVSQLRKLLGDADLKPTYIATIPRKGYRLIATVQRGTLPAETFRAPVMPGRPATLRRVWFVAGALVILTLVATYFLIDMGKLSKNEVTVSRITSDKSIAVLPFVDMSEKHDEEYFADGMSEELINTLAKVPELHVPARTSSFYFKGKQTTIPEIAKALGVANVLEGSVRKSGNTLRITAQLIRVDNGYHVWSTSFDRPLGDIFQIQDEIANAVVRALRASLGTSASIPSDDTSNSTSYDLYLRADSAYRRSNKKEDYQKIVEELQDAIRIDPSFARGWALLSRTLSTMAGYSFVEPAKGFEDARHAALKALELKPTEPVGHLALAKILYLHDWNWEGADEETQKALTANPNDPGSLYMAGILASILGHADKAWHYAKRATDIDPLNFTHFDILGEYSMDAGHFKEAQKALRRAQELNPSYLSAHWSLGQALLLDRKTSEALAEFERESEGDFRIAGRALSYHALGRTADALEALHHLESLVEQSRRGFFLVAEIYAFRGDRDQAFAWLARAYEQRETLCGSVKLDPLLNNVRSDPRYKAFLKKMNLPEG
jgi:TolB-like protein/DNA-binding winged helix-turn-helix (wHTH) protein/cytochrome c-type biogenesis protein CcmH/NrfG